MLYTYRCEVCKVEEDLNYGMLEARPKAIPCSKCGTGYMFRVFGSATIIPDHMKATTENTVRYDKKKKYYY